jgi:hypothetical protein
MLALRRWYTSIAPRARTIATGQWGAPLMSSYLDILTYLAFGILMAVCLWYVDGSLKDDAD